MERYAFAVFLLHVFFIWFCNLLGKSVDDDPYPRATEVFKFITGLLFLTSPITVTWLILSAVFHW